MTAVAGKFADSVSGEYINKVLYSLTQVQLDGYSASRVPSQNAGL